MLFEEYPAYAHLTLEKQGQIQSFVEDKKFEVVHAELSLNRARVRGDKEIGEGEEILECLNEELELKYQESQTT